MSYFTAVIAGDGRSWRARDVDVEDAGTLDDLADTLRAASHRGGPVLAVIEREDEWFALVRVDGDEDPRLFVSDMHAASRSPYGELLAPAADVDVDLDVDLGEDPAPATGAGGGAGDPAGGAGGGPDPDDEPAQERVSDVDDDLGVDVDEAAPGVPDPAAWAGEPDLLADLGCSGADLRELVDQRSDDPAGVLGEVGEACGFGDLLDALR